MGAVPNLPIKYALPIIRIVRGFNIFKISKYLENPDIKSEPLVCSLRKKRRGGWTHGRLEYARGVRTASVDNSHCEIPAEAVRTPVRTPTFQGSSRVGVLFCPTCISHIYTTFITHHKVI